MRISSFFFIFFPIFITGCHTDTQSGNNKTSTNIIEINKPEPGAFIEVQCPETKETKIKYLGFVKNFDWSKKLQKVLPRDTCKTGFGVDHTRLGFYNCKYEVRGEYGNGKEITHSNSTREKTYVNELVQPGKITYIEIDTSPND